MRMCKNCMWVYHMVAHNPTAPCEDCKDYDKWQTTKPTNADRIRAMTDEELVFFFWGTVDGSGKTVEQWREWLKQERDENGKT